MNILVTGVGGPTPRSFVKSLKYYSGLDSFRTIGTDVNPLAFGLYQKSLFDRSYLVPRADDPGYWQAIEQIIEDEKIDLAIILPEIEVLEWSKRKETSDLPCNVLLPDYELAEILVDKAKMTEFLSDTGLVPKSIEFSRLDSVDDLFDVFEGEFWVRSSLGSCGLGSLKIHSKELLANWIDMNQEVETFLASTYLPGRNLACKMLYYDGVLMRSATAERVDYVMAKSAPSGITGNTSFGRLINEPHLMERASQALDHLFEYTQARKHGFFTVDFKENRKGEALITEINIRLVAFTQCFAAGGANFAEDTIRLLKNDPEFDRSFQHYEFEKDLIFLREVDEVPILMKESELFASLPGKPEVVFTNGRGCY